MPTIEEILAQQLGVPGGVVTPGTVPTPMATGPVPTAPTAAPVPASADPFADILAAEQNADPFSEILNQEAAQLADLEQRTQQFLDNGGDDFLVRVGRGAHGAILAGQAIGNRLGLVDDQTVLDSLDMYNAGADPRMERLALDWDNAEGAGETAGAVWDNKGAIGGLLAEQLPGMVVGGAGGKVATTAGVKVAEGIAKKTATELGKKIAVGAGTGAGATIAGGAGPNIAEGMGIALEEAAQKELYDPRTGEVLDPEGLQEFMLSRGTELGLTRTAVEATITALTGGVTPFRLAPNRVGDLALQTGVQAAGGAAEEYAGAKSVGQDASSLELALGAGLEAVGAPIEIAQSRSEFREKQTRAAAGGDQNARAEVAQDVLTETLNSPGKGERLAAELTKIIQGNAPDRNAVTGDGGEQTPPGMVPVPDLEPPTTPEPAADRKEKPAIDSNGPAARIYTPDGNEVAGTWQVVDAATLAPAISKADNQARNRESVASQRQIEAIGSNPQFGRLADSPEMDSGAPTIMPDGTIIGGNGRMAGLQRAYEQGTAAQYRADLEADAQRRGIQTDTSGMTAPVLVRVLPEGSDVRSLALQSNEGGSAAMSAMEQASVDAERLPHLDDLAMTDDGELNTPANRQFFRNFVGAMPEGQRARFIGADGQLSQEGLARVRNAVLRKAYGDSPTLGRLVESTDSDGRNVLNALMRAAPTVAKRRDEIARGLLHDADIADDLASALELLVQLRADNRRMVDFEAQADLVGHDLTPETVELARFMEANIRSAKKIAALITDYYDALDRRGSPDQGSMFGDDTPPTTGELLGEARQQGQDGTERAAVPSPAAQDRPADAPGPEGQGSDAGRAGEGQRDVAQRGIYDRRIEEFETLEQAQAYIDELRTALMTDERTGLGSNRAWLERKPKTFVASIDLDSLKFVNDNMGHAAGDRMIELMGEALRQAGIGDDSYHVSGDEFYAQGNDGARLRAALDRAQAWLADQVIEGDNADYQGPGFSYGIAKDLDDAEDKLQAHKSERETRGDRAARGERPQGFNQRTQEPGGSARDDSSPSGTGQGEQPQSVKDDLLSSYTEEELAERAEADKARQRQEEQDRKKREADAQRDNFQLTGSDSEADQAAAAGQQSLFERGEQYQSDLFVPRRGTPDLPKETAKAQARDNFLLRYEAVPNGQEISVGLDQVHTPSDVLHVVAPFRKHAQETMLAIVTDKAGNLLEVIRHTKGIKNAATVSVPELVGAIAAVEGGARVWFSHNHPSGSTVPSGADYKITDALESAMDGLGMNYRGHIVIGAAGQGTFFRHNGEGTPIEATKRARGQRIQIKERVIRKAPPKHRINVNSPAQALRVVKKVESDNAVLLLDGQHNELGSLAMSPEEMKKLREGGRVRRLWRAIDSTNAHAVVIKSTDEDAARNMARFFNAIPDLNVLDVFTSKDTSQGRLWFSDAEKGGEIGSDFNFFESRGDTGTGLSEAQALDILRGTFGKDVVQKLQDKGLLVFGTTDDKGLKGTWDGEKATLYPDNLEPHQVAGVLLHELGEHANLETMLGERYQELVRGFDDLLAKGDRLAVAADNAAKGAGVPEQHLASERLAYLVQLVTMEEKPTAGARELVRRLIAAIKLALAPVLRKVGITLQPTDVAALARRAMDDLAERGTGTGQGRESRDGFKAWFGDSQVVDAQGQPKVVYHGSERAGFAAFDPDMAGENTGRDFKGFYFTESPMGAETYSGTRREAEITDDYDGEGEPGNYPVYLSMQNPMIVDFEGQGWDAEIDGFFGMDELVEFAEDAGYDGVIARNLVDEGRHGQGYGWDETTYVVFKPEQIKSATENRGSYDATNPDIRESRSELDRALGMTDQEYLAEVNPTGKVLADDDVVTLHIGDLDLPKGSRLVAEDKGLRLYQDAGGSLYAVRNGDVLGLLSETGNGETVVDVVTEAQGRGVGTALVKQNLRRNPFAHAGGFSKAGKATRLKALRELRQERGGVKESRGNPEPPKTDLDASKPNLGANILGRDAAGRLEFVPGKNAYDAGARFLRATLGRVGLVDTAPESFRRAMRAYNKRQRDAVETATSVAKSGGELSPAERRIISDIIEQQMATGMVPPEHLVDLAGKIKTVFDQQAQDLLDLGMLTQDSVDRWRDTYLPRYYAKHANANAFRMFRQALKGIKGSHLKGRGLFEEVRLGDLPAYVEMDWEVRGNHPKIDAWYAEHYDGKTLPAGTTEDTRIRVWRDFTPLERQKMGEIRDGLYRFAMGYLETQQDIAMGRLFQTIAEQPDLANKVPVDSTWKQLPDGNASPGVKRYGKLAGMYVHPEVAKQLEYLAGYDRSAIMRTYLKGMAWWKEGKTVLNPAVHMNNVVSNVSLASWAGIHPWEVHKYAKAVAQVKNNGKWYQEAKQAGLLGNGISRAELETYVPELANLKQGDDVTNTLLNNTLGALKRNTWNKYRDAMRKAYEFEDEFFKLLIYTDQRERGVDQETAVEYAERYIFNYSLLPSGGKKVRDFPIGLPFFSFIYFAARAAAHTAMVHPHRFAVPLAIYGGLNWLMYAMQYEDPEEQERYERNAMPTYMKGDTVGGVPRNIRMMNSDQGEWVYLDIYRWVPLGDVFDSNNQMGGIPLPQTITPNNPLFTLTAGLLWNRDSFFGEEIVPSHMLERNEDTGKLEYTAEAWTEVGRYVAAQMLPSAPLVPGSYHFNQYMEGAVTTFRDGEPLGPYTGLDRGGDPVTFGKAVRHSVGIKDRRVMPDEGLVQQRRDIAFRILEVQRSMRSIAKRKNVPQKTIDNQLAEKRKQIERLTQQLQSLNALSPPEE